MPKSIGDWLKLAFLCLIIAIGVVGFSQRQAIGDYIKLANYSPSHQIQALANETTMTPKARHLFYINRPELQDKAQFRQSCPDNDEKTIILGCYRGNESGIFLLKVSDPRLNGVEQVTAAHEMLHAAYARLNSSEKVKVDRWLRAYFKTVTNETLKKTINSYKKSEPNAVVDEMHSVFGSEVADLPPNLENYYKRYFTNRKKVTNYASSYRSTFEQLKRKVASYDRQLEALRTSISNDEARAKTMRAALSARQATLNRGVVGGDVAEYNSQINQYNSEVDAYNQLVGQIKSEVASYNNLVRERNALAIDINSLNQELDADSVKQVSPAS